ncbi:hypothetical protein FA09DRAFT_160864 [Tilletiopsis washingtonensis]|uniref:Alpha/beta-hydrolase n=1 Tax=Tilletiopsis washingtonensis TaxID=58919 RepID=A0A316Z1Q5_9BASI|nr:hypothetical protein FA09DRAFT_160864 [Tilletiopsis washingtonensis]PWN94852.1 hypothetical protein FA09DRAFT_160864 [Tilletiopsis washingtonensis]
MRLSLLALLSLASSVFSLPTEPHAGPPPARQQQAERRGEGGWGPAVQDPGTIVSLIPVRGADAALYAWTREGQDWEKLKRIVFVIHGKGRDPWNYLNHTTTALQDAIAAGQPVTDDEVGIWAPSFWNNQDGGAWPWDEATQQPTSNLLVWSGNEWQDGGNSIYPSGLNLSSFEVLDNVVSFFSNRAIFPNVDSITFSSHSMGSQLLQKYAFLGDIPQGIPSLRFAIGNLGAFTYFDDQRPSNVGGAEPVEQCGDYNDYRFGLNNVDSTIEYGSPTPNRELLLERFKSRTFHLLLSQNDDGPGNLQCAAKTQGDSHRTRGAAWWEYMNGPMGGWPANHTLDWIPDCTHDDLCVFRSAQAQVRLFLNDSMQQPSFMPNGPVNNLWSAGSVQWARGANATQAMPTGTTLSTAALQTYIPSSTTSGASGNATQAGGRQQTNGQVSSTNAAGATATTAMQTLVLGAAMVGAGLLLV